MIVTDVYPASEYHLVADIVDAPDPGGRRGDPLPAEAHGQPKATFLPQHWDHAYADTWWHMSPETVRRYVGVLGFEKTEITYHHAYAGGRRTLLYTVVGQRTRVAPTNTRPAARKSSGSTGVASTVPPTEFARPHSPQANIEPAPTQVSDSGTQNEAAQGWCDRGGQREQPQTRSAVPRRPCVSMTPSATPSPRSSRPCGNLPQRTSFAVSTATHLVRAYSANAVASVMPCQANPR